MKRTALICYTSFDSRSNKRGGGYATVGFEGSFTGTLFNEKMSQLTESIQGQDAWKIVESWSSHPESDQLIADQVLGEKARKENWAKQIAELGKRPTQAQLDALQKQASDAVKEATQAKNEAKSVREENQRLEEIQTSDKEAGEALSRRIGQWLKKYLP